MADKSQRTEQPTQRKLDRARKEGRFPISREFVSAVQFLIAVVFLTGWAQSWLGASRQMMRFFLTAGFRPGQGAEWPVGLAGVAWFLVGKPLFTVGAALFSAALCAQLLSTGFGLSLSRLGPDLTRLNPLERISRLPQQNFPQLVQALVLLPLFAVLVFWLIQEHTSAFLRLPSVGLESGLRLIAGSMDDLLWKAAAVFGILGFFDLWRQRRRWNSEMRMSKQEIKDEMKEVEGNPAVKSKIRRMMREMSRRRMMKDVETATTVVVNPTHYAVAIRYVPAEMPAPKVVAKGKNFLAKMIRERAIRNQVPIVENPPLARSLYQSTEVGQEIPAHLYRAVAEVLAYIFRLMNGRQPFRQ